MKVERQKGYVEPTCKATLEVDAHEGCFQIKSRMFLKGLKCIKKKRKYMKILKNASQARHVSQGSVKAMSLSTPMKIQRRDYTWSHCYI